MKLDFRFVFSVPLVSPLTVGEGEGLSGEDLWLCQIEKSRCGNRGQMVIYQKDSRKMFNSWFCCRRIEVQTSVVGKPLQHFQGDLACQTGQLPNPTAKIQTESYFQSVLKMAMDLLSQ